MVVPKSKHVKRQAPSAVFARSASAALVFCFGSAFTGGCYRNIRAGTVSTAHLKDEEPAVETVPGMAGLAPAEAEVVGENSSRAIRLLYSEGLQTFQATLEKLQAAKAGEESVLQATLKNIPAVISNITEQEIPTDLESDFEQALEATTTMLSPADIGEGNLTLGPTLFRQLLQLSLVQRLPEMMRRLGQLELLYPKSLEEKTEVSQEELKEALEALAEELKRGELAEWSDEDFAEAQDLIDRSPVLGPVGEALAETADEALEEFYGTTAGAAAFLIIAQLVLVGAALAACASCFGGDGGSNAPVPVDTETLPLYTLGGTFGGWYRDLDDLWSNVLSYFEKRGILSEETLEYLDADPFVLFGVDDPLTQQALLKLDKFPALMCDGAVPTQDEWAYYLRIEPRDTQLVWLVRAMQETELPKPWTCYKGIGSIVCYLRSDSGQVTWKHPFYDYFRQLRDFCRQASRDEVMQVRCNRLLWSYEATRVETEHDQEPLISPPYVARMADIFGFDVKVQGCVVRNCKAQLKAFAKAYRTKQDIDIGLIRECNEMLQRDVAKYSEMVAHWSGEVKEDVKFDLNKLAAGELHCVNCKTTALSFCLECKDYLCLKCYADLHGKGSRKEHAPFCLVPCALCVVLPAKIHCTFTDKSLCHKCYAMKHIKMLPLDGKENQPRRINYVEQYNRYAEFAKERVKKMAVKPEDLPALDDSAYESVLSTDWHPFYDARGVRYYHNFATGERMRQSPRRVPNSDDAGAEATTPTAKEVTQALAVSQEDAGGMARPEDPASSKGFHGTATSLKSTGPLPLSGFDSLKSDVPAAVRAAEDPEHRLLRPPHRRHMPDEITEPL
ncbi:unnamed protein product [Symbiodinium sp. KB8]|nr:unnamed protein product [Symbiodinium sp. KB8]